MADTKISALTGATTPVAGTEVLPIVQSSTTVNVSITYRGRLCIFFRFHRNRGRCDLACLLLERVEFLRALVESEDHVDGRFRLRID